MRACKGACRAAWSRMWRAGKAVQMGGKAAWGHALFELPRSQKAEASRQ